MAPRFRPRHIARKNVVHVQRTFGSAVREDDDGKALRGLELAGRRATGLFPMVVVEMKAGSRGNQRQAAHWLRTLGLDCKLLQSVGDVEVYDVWGAGEAIEVFLSVGLARGFVRDWSMPVNTRVGLGAAGSGPELQAKHRRPLPWTVEAVKREDRRAQQACEVRKAGHSDHVRRAKLFD